MDEVNRKSSFRNRLIFILGIGFISNFAPIGIRQEKNSARNWLIHRGGGVRIINGTSLYFQDTKMLTVL